ncbi:MAG: nickel pincer cofactor biosynthesis protein LarC [Pirellulales bacterium]|nr:nickel pincer cofactor biosynthesis protein LarC [Pirellulales bacterium]
MKTGYLDCTCGISGDMTLGALVDAGVEIDQLNEVIGSFGLPGCRLVAQEVRKHGFRATQVTVEYTPEQPPRHLSEILSLIEASRLNSHQKDTVGRIFRRLGEAEARVHGVPVEKVHFHEVGAVDSIVDIVGVAVGFDLLGIERLAASPVPTGGGTLDMAHGRCGIPAPATVELLRGIPLAESSIQAELTTPTGAAILATLVDRFGPVPAMTIDRIGCGAGQRDLEGQANVLRLFVGRAAADQNETPEAVWVVETNLDDLSGQMIGYCIERLWETGALDVWTTPIQMKKNRPGVTLSVLCRADQIESVQEVLFAETTTLGVRCWPATRRVLARQAHQVETPWGPVQGKIAWLPDGSARFAPEYESCRQVATERNMVLRLVHEVARNAFDPSTVRRDN